MRAKKKMRFCIFTMILIMIMSIVVMIPAEAASQKKLQSVSLKISGKNVTKKTYSMSKGETAVIKAEAKPVSARKSVLYKSSDKRIVTVSKKGKITAKRNGTAKIRVTVKAKKGKKKTVWLKVKVISAKKNAGIIRIL